jgi:hypothetical protein
VIGDLVTGLDVLDRANLDDVFYEIDFRIGPAGMIDIARPISTARAVDRPTAVNLKKVAIIDFVGLFGT